MVDMRAFVWAMLVLFSAIAIINACVMMAVDLVISLGIIAWAWWLLK